MLLKGCGEIYSENQSLGTIEAVGLYCKLNISMLLIQYNLIKFYSYNLC
jgi:hypothetical protein